MRWNLPEAVPRPDIPDTESFVKGATGLHRVRTLFDLDVALPK